MHTLGDLLMIGFDGTRMTRALELFLKETGAGGVILFARNYERPRQLRRLIDALCDAAGRRLVVAVDQEGGRVARFHRPFTALPPMRALGRADVDAKRAEAVGALLGEELRAVGVTLDFAPVLDVDTNRANPVIGDRAFSHDPQRVAELGAAFVRGMQGAGIAACGKHFPGHGDTDLDSHKALPLLPHTRGRFEACELVPFRAAIDTGVAAMMTAHLAIPNLDAEWPATFSHRITTELLREELGFDGCVFTDDLTMAGIAGVVPMHEVAWRAIAAGADVALICHRPEVQRAALEGLRKAVDDGVLAEARVADALRRAAHLREGFGTEAKRPSLRRIGCRAHHRLIRTLGRVPSGGGEDPTAQWNPRSLP